MMKRKKEIFTENPLDEQWQMLLQFSHLENCKRYIEKESAEKADNRCLDIISGSILQAKEYFYASQLVSLNVSPLLLYYGATNLFNGAMHLKANKYIEIHDHGMQLIQSIDENSRIAENCIKAVNQTTGGSEFVNTLRRFSLGI